MAKVHEVKHARKAIPSAGIKVGDPYFWWKFMVGGRGGAKRVSKTYPRRSQTTQSEFYAAVYDLEDRLADMKAENYETTDDLKSDLEDIASEARALGEEQGEKFDNMPEGLRQGDTGQLLEERRDACEAWADELDAIEVEEVDEDAVATDLRTKAKDAGADAPTDEEIAGAVKEAIRDAVDAAISEAQQTSSPE